jgi:hypothetical protein
MSERREYDSDFGFGAVEAFLSQATGIASSGGSRMSNASSSASWTGEARE